MDINTVYLSDSFLTILLLFLTIINFTALIICGTDKLRAETGKMRIRERTLLTVSFFGGAFGMLIGMLIFRHKTRKPKFIFCVPFFLIIQLFILFLLEVNYGLFSKLIL